MSAILPLLTNNTPDTLCEHLRGPAEKSSGKDGLRFLLADLLRSSFHHYS